MISFSFMSAKVMQACAGTKHIAESFCMCCFSEEACVSSRFDVEITEASGKGRKAPLNFALCTKNIMFVMHNKLHMEFVDRIAETARLEAALSGEKSTLVVMYGRRRLGKSTLIKRVLSEGDVYFLADRSEGQHQRGLGVFVPCGQLPDRQAFHPVSG